MRTAVTHINLLQKSTPRHLVGPAFVLLAGVTLTVLTYTGFQAYATQAAVAKQRDSLQKQALDMQAAIAAMNGAQQKNAAAIALRKEVETLQPAAQAAQAFLQGVQSASQGRSEDFARALAVLTRSSEPGLWLTSVKLVSGGTKLEVRGEARDGASVLRYARKVNDALRPLGLRMDQLAVLGPNANGPAAAGGAVTFVLS